MVLSLIYAWLYFKNNTAGSLFKTILGTGTVFALLVGGYHGLLLSSLGRPLWAGGMVAALFLVSSVLGGTALLILLKELGISFGVPQKVGREIASASDAKGINFTVLFCTLSALQLILVLSWQISISRGALETSTTATSLMDQFGGLWISLVLLGGLVLPLLGSLYSLIKNKSSEMSKGMALTLSTLVIVGGFTFKHIVLLAGQIKLLYCSKILLLISRKISEVDLNGNYTQRISASFSRDRASNCGDNRFPGPQSSSSRGKYIGIR